MQKPQKAPFFCCERVRSCYKPAARGIAAGVGCYHAGVAELVDALDLGSSDESCGGSSPSARTKRFQRLPDEFWRAYIPDRDVGFAEPLAQAARPCVDEIYTVGPLGPAQAEED